MLSKPLAVHFRAVQERWSECLNNPDTNHFIEFALALNSATEQCKERKLPGLSRLCEGLQNEVMSLSDNSANFPLNPTIVAALTRQVETILSSVETSRKVEVQERRTLSTMVDVERFDATRPRTIWLVATAAHPWCEGLAKQLDFFGFAVRRFDWEDPMPPTASPLVILFIPQHEYGSAETERIQRIRAHYQASQLFCLSVPELLDPMVNLLRAGADLTIPAVQETTTVLAHVLDLIEAQDQEPYRVLVVEDSPTATAMIRRTLEQHGIANYAIGNPEHLLEAVWRYQPDLVLMDMHMPHCTGVEATRVLRQIPACRSLPVVYLSSETDIGMQMAALRLGGDQFIAKPFNPVLMTTIVKSKIERYREMQRSGVHDSLTGLLNHTASKTRLNNALLAMGTDVGTLCVVMIDIDHFKSINDVHGHPVGDQVIRNLAWLLKGRLRATDIIGRYGGEEFMVVLRGIGMNEGYDMIDRIRDDFAALPHVYAQGSLHASFSAGIASYPLYATDSELIAAADNALLEAKRRGRNRLERAAL
ncbi:MAG: diguanylate cyclase [Burkholderiaceae bacterium]